MSNEISVLHAEKINIPAVNSKTNNTFNVVDHTFQESISRGIGHYVICEFLIGFNKINTREGILREVGKNYFILYNEETDSTISCDLDCLKFATFYSSNPNPSTKV